MKQRYIFTAMLCCLLLFAGLNAAAQQITTPLPAPDREKSIIPDVPETKVQAPAQSGRSEPQAEVPAAAPATAAPAASAPPATAPAADRNTGTSGSASRTAAGPAAPAPAEIPSKGWFWGTMLGMKATWFDNARIDGNDVTRGNMSGGYGGRVGGGEGFEGGLLLGYDFGLLALQVEFLMSSESMKTEMHYYESSGTYSWYRADSETHLSGVNFQIPLMLKLDLHWKRLMFQPQVGLYFNFGSDMNYEGGYSYSLPYNNGSGQEEGQADVDPPLLGAMFGGAFGVRIGRGYLFLDVRYALDFGKTVIFLPLPISYGNDFEGNRSFVTSNLGYQYYFKGKK
jgi:hypothetical protein